jgi:hypothetical protein
MATDAGQQSIDGISRRSVLRGGLLAGAGVATMGATSAVLTGTATAAAPNPQIGWGWCVYCSVMWWVKGQTHSACPSEYATDGLHWVGAGNHNYELNTNRPGLNSQSNPQPGWRWCSNCQGLFWGQSGSVCQGNQLFDGGLGPHAFGSGTSYDLDWTAPGPSSGKSNPQQYWSWCDDCHLLFYEGELPSGPVGVCPEGSGHAPGSITVYSAWWSGSW